jgi:hypothetical protein
MKTESKGYQKMWYPPNSGGNPPDLLKSQSLIIECVLCLFECIYLFDLFLVYVFRWKLWVVLRALNSLSFDFFGIYVSIFIYLNFNFLVVQFFLGLCAFFEVIIINHNCTQIIVFTSTILNPICDNHHEMRKINWTPQQKVLYIYIYF